MKFRQFIVGVIGIASAWNVQLAFGSSGSFQCAQSQWDFQNFNSEDELNAEISKVCSVTFDTPRSLQSVMKSMNSRVTATYSSVGSATSGVFSGFKGQSYPVTLNTTEGGGTDAIKGVYQVGISDDGKSLMSLFESNSIKGTGNGKYLRAFSEKIEILTKTPENRAFELRVTQRILLDKPSFLIPDTFFEHEADDGISKAFDHELGIILEQIKLDFDSSEAR